MPRIVVPAGVIYVCVTGSGSTVAQTAIEYVPHVDALCRKHPEMDHASTSATPAGARAGACCVGRLEITMATEAVYDKKVRRVTFKAN
jgi:hypothetical protein